MEYTYSIIAGDQETVNEVRELTRKFPKFYCTSVSSDYEESLNNVLRNNPSLVFIDLDTIGNMCDPFWFTNELHHYLEELPAFVGLSLSKNLAYDAIKNGFFDLLLKPLSEFDLRKCLMKYEKNSKKRSSEKLCLKSYSDYRFVEFEEILYLKADNNTTDFFLTQGRKVSAYKTLKYFEQSLPDGFLRVHHSYIINTRQVNRINYGKSLITLQGQCLDIPFSKSYKLQVDQLKENLITSLSIVS